MEARFWHERWESNQIGFHKDEVNPRLVEHFGALALPAGARVFVPLCGKTRDIGWLMQRGHRVAGAELSAIAVEQLFEDMGITPEITREGPLTRYSAPGVDIHAGDIFDMDRAVLGAVDAVYDRAALVALPPDMRVRYAAHVVAITGRAPQLAITFLYDQSVMPGPPFSVPDEEFTRLYGDAYALTPLATAAVPGGLKGVCPADETVWLAK